MSLTLLVAIVAAGIALVVLAVHMSGGSTPATLADEAAARARFAQDFPDLAIRAVRLTRDRGAAFLQLADGRVGMVRAVGGKFLTRIITSANIAGAPRASETNVAIRMRDFTFPGGVFSFDACEEAKAVEAMFAALRRQTMWEKAS